MTVAELIELLEKEDPNAEVRTVGCCFHCTQEIESVDRYADDDGVLVTIEPKP